MQKLLPFITKPLTTTPSSDLKTELLRLTTLSDKQKFEALTHDTSLGDLKPSELLIHMENIQGPERDASFFKQLFLSKLPLVVQTALATVPNSTPLKELAEIADKVQEVQKHPQISSLKSDDPEDRFTTISIQLSDL